MDDEPVEMRPRGCELLLLGVALPELAPPLELALALLELERSIALPFTVIPSSGMGQPPAKSGVKG
jgi:hypothetical protein